jgi:hypothetical protein
MKWFDRWFYNRCKRAWEMKSHYDESDAKIAVLERGIKLNTLSAVESDPHELNDGLRINVKRVIGGSIVTFRHYERKVDCESQRTYIITDEQDFEKELGKMITLESMRQTQ